MCYIFNIRDQLCIYAIFKITQIRCDSYVSLADWALSLKARYQEYGNIEM